MVKSLPGGELSPRRLKQYLQLAELYLDVEHRYTQAEMAAMLKVTDKSVRNWLRDPRFKELVQGQRDGLAFEPIQQDARNRLREIYQNIWRIASDPENPQSLKANEKLLELAGEEKEGDKSDERSYQDFLRVGAQAAVEAFQQGLEAGKNTKEVEVIDSE